MPLVRRLAQREGFLGLGVTLLVFGCGGGRQPASLAEVRLGDDARTLIVSVNSCQGSPSASVAEEPDRVVITAEANLDSDRTCLDGLTIELGEILGQRDVIDGVSGQSMSVTAR